MCRHVPKTGSQALTHPYVELQPSFSFISKHYSYLTRSNRALFNMPSETEPLLPRYEDDTSRQRRLHQKLHSYQMVRAISEGYMPTTEQTIANLRTLLASDILNLRNQDIGSVGRQLVRDSRLWIQVFIEFLEQKNGQDQLQQFLWRLARSRVEVDSERVSRQAAHVKARADTKAGGSRIFPLCNSPACGPWHMQITKLMIGC